MGAPLGPSTAGTVCPSSPVTLWTSLLSQLLLNPPLQLLTTGSAVAPFSQGCWAPQVQGQGPHLLEGAGAGLWGPPKGQGCQHCLSTWPCSCQPGGTFIHPFMCLQGQRS